MEGIKNGAFVYCIESLPRLKSVQLSFHTSYHRLSLSNQSLSAREGPSIKEEVDVRFCSCKLDPASHSHISITDSIVSFKLTGCSSLLPHGIAPPGEVLESSGSNPAIVTLVCSFCNSTLTSKDK